MTTIQVYAKAVLLGAFLMGGAATLPACGAKEYLNCNDLCQKRRDCVDTNYDVGNCTSVCSDKANADANYAREVDTCKECISPLACTDYKVAACLPNCPALP